MFTKEWICYLIEKEYHYHKRRVSAISQKMPWNLERLNQTPDTYQLARDDDGITALFYRSAPYQGRETRVFAYYGSPHGASPEQTVPAVLLVHGGAGTAFREWVKKWNERGYAAFAMDLEGHIPEAVEEQPTSSAVEWKTHRWSGPIKQGVFADYRQPVGDQWMYHALEAVVRAHSLLRSFPEVDRSRVGIVGVSWGGIITSLVSGLDDRLCFAVPIYGCGFLHEPVSGYGLSFAAMRSDDAEWTRRLWDPSEYLPRSRLPMLWLNGVNDSHFPLSIFVKSYDLNKRCHPNSRLSLHYGLGHSHEDAWACEEPYAFADSVTKRAPELASILEEHQLGGQVVVRYASSLPLAQAVLYWCSNDRDWRTDEWKPIAVRLEEESIAQAELPDGHGRFFMNLTNSRGWTTSTRVRTDNRQAEAFSNENLLEKQGER